MLEANPISVPNSHQSTCLTAPCRARPGGSYSCSMVTPEPRRLAASRASRRVKHAVELLQECNSPSGKACCSWMTKRTPQPLVCLLLQYTHSHKTHMFTFGTPAAGAL
eukprot:967644-Pelagomonas_calceolata.AAC.5